MNRTMYCAMSSPDKRPSAEDGAGISRGDRRYSPWTLWKNRKQKKRHGPKKSLVLVQVKSRIDAVRSPDAANTKVSRQDLDVRVAIVDECIGRDKACNARAKDRDGV